MKRFAWKLCVVQIVLFLAPFEAIPAGISVDAGLTPAEDRWIVRTQWRYMERHDDPTTMGRRMERYLFNAVVAYGLRRDLTLILRQPVVHQEMSMAGSKDRESGLADLSLLAKYKIYRQNTRFYTFGAAATLGLELPTGAEAFTSNTWDLKPGLFLSWRRGRWASDFNIDYAWNGFSDEGVGDIDPGDEVSIDWALAHQFSIGREADITLAPVLEISYKNITRDRLDNRTVENTGETIVYISPGIKFTRSSFIFEALAQIPVWQDQEGSQLERSSVVLAGMRFMF